MQIVLFRHAEKDHTDSNDPPLSAYGKSQALKLRDMLLKHDIVQPTKLMTSIKLRAQETLQPVSEALKIPIEKYIELDERQKGEPKNQFDQRVRQFLTRLEDLKGQSVFVVSHLDWIEIALALMNSDIDVAAQHGYAWSPAQFVEFEVDDGVWRFISAGQVAI